MKAKYSIFMAMLVLAIFAVGAVSAAENVTADIDVPTDDIAIDDVTVDGTDESGKVVEPTRALHTVNNSMSNSDINQEIVAAYNDNTNHVVDFTYGTYYGASFTVQDNVVLDGHGSTLIGDGTNDIFIVTQKSNFVIKNFIIDINCTSAAAVYGHHVSHAVITNNTMFNGRDGVNIFQVHENLTITDNTIYDFDRDGISLVNFNTYSDSDWNSFVASEVSGNKITGGQYGMFFGGNFKGTIADNIINGSGVGVEFAGKRLPTNGRLDANFDNNTIINVETGINMLHPDVEYFNITSCNVSASDYAIYAEDPFGTSVDYIGVYNSAFVGDISSEFEDAVGTNYGNNIGFPS